MATAGGRTTSSASLGIRIMVRNIGYRPIEILLVEDNPGDARLVAEVLREVRARSRLHVVSDGEEALAFLRRQGMYTSMPRPDIIILDLNLPKKDGREVLVEIKDDGDLRRIPVIVLTNSRAEEDILRSYDSYGNCYVAKTENLDDLLNIIRSINDFWLTMVKLPPR